MSATGDRRRCGDRRDRAGRLGRGPGADRGGLVGDHAREGPQPPALARAALRAARPPVQRRDQADPPPPARTRPAGRAPHLPAPRPTTATTWSSATSTRCRRPSAAAATTPTPRCPACARTTSALRSDPRARSTGADVADWPFAYDDLEPYYAEVERIVGVAGEETNPFAAWRSAPYPMPPGRRHVRRRALDGGRRAGRAASLPGPDRHQLGALRRPAGLQQLRVLRLVRLPDRRQGRSGGAAAAGPAHRPLRDPPRVAGHRGRPRRLGPPGHAGCATSTPSAVEHEVRADHVVLAAGAFETPRLMLRPRGSATRRGWSGATSCSTSRR